MVEQLYIKQKVLSLSEHFTVVDAAQRMRYQVEGSFLHIPKTFHILNATGNEVARIEKQVFSWLPHFSVFVNNEQIASIDKELSFFKSRYHIDAQGLEIAGDWWDMNFTVLRNGTPIASITQQWLSWGDTYEVSINDDSSELLIVALVIAIDKVKHDANAADTAASPTS